MPSDFLKKISESLVKRLLKEGMEKIFPRGQKKKQTVPSSKESNTTARKSHPWRMCSIGQHWVREHDLTVPASNEGPPKQTIRRGHCRANSSESETYTADELREIVKQHFNGLAHDSNVMPVPDSLGYPSGNKYDEIIGGWTKFWNETLLPTTPLSPDFVKALIATESGFDVGVKDQQSKIGAARGLIQITESTRKILKNPKGELKDHLIEITAEESREAEINIAAGIRWLHHKKKLASNRLRREATWEEAGAEYKGILADLGKDEKSDDIMKKLKRFQKKLQDQRVLKK